MTRPKIYCSGPITDGGALPIWSQKEHVRFATEVAFVLIRRGYSVYIPQLTLLGEELVHEHLPHNLWVDQDLPWVAAADAVYRLPGESKGADIECDYAREKGLPVFRDFIAMDGHFRARKMLP